MEQSAERLTYDEATPEQVAEARETARRKLDDASRRHTPDYFAKLRARFGVTAEPA